MRPSMRIAVPLIVLLVIHAGVLFAGFVAPYGFADQDRALPFAPPTALHLRDTRGTFHWPFVYGTTQHFDEYEEDRSQIYPIHLLPQASEYKMLGAFSCDRHLFGLTAPARISLMGTDGYGRDVFSRVLYGGQVSLLAGLLATVLSLALGVTLGTVAGFYGKWTDAAIMRVDELFLALPWLYLLFALRAFLPMRINPTQAFLLLIAVIGVVGWARPARLIRGVVLSAKERGYVVAGRGFGASDLYLLRRHILPQTKSIVLTQAALLIPQYILAEVTLSFLGLGVGEPVPSWGSMLATLQQYHVLVAYWWMFFPGLILIPVFLSYGMISKQLQMGEMS